MIRRANPQSTQQTSSVSCLGKIKVGKISDKGYPTSLDYFRFVPNVASHQEIIEKHLGATPRNVEIFFISDEHGGSYKSFRELRDGQGKTVATMTFNQEYEAEFNVVSSLKKGEVRHLENGMEKLIYKDEINFDFWSADRIKSKGLDANTFAQKLLEKAKIGARKPEQIQWEEILILRFLILKLPMLGYWEFRTKGTESTIPTICSTLESVMKAAGTISRIPFDLSVRKSASDKSGDRRSYPVVSLVLNLDQERLEKLEQLGNSVKSKLLTASRIDELTKLQIQAPIQDEK